VGLGPKFGRPSTFSPQQANLSRYIFVSDWKFDTF